MIKELVKNARSFRTFDESVRISRETLVDLIDTARLTSSAMNIQPLKYKPVYKKEDLDTMLSLTKWAAALKDIKLPPIGKAPTGYIIVCHDKNILPSPERSDKDVGIVSEAIMLAAAEIGLGGCMILNFVPQKVADAFALGDNIVPKLVIALGKPDEKVELVDVSDGDDVAYFRKDGVHYVPKRKLEDIIL